MARAGRGFPSHSTLLSGPAPTGPFAQTISPTGLTSAEAFGVLTVGRGAVTVSPSAIATGYASGTAQLNQKLPPTGIAASYASGSATVSPGAVTISPS